MAFLEIPNVSIKGLSACVPKSVLENKHYRGFLADEADKIIETIGIERRRIAGEEICASDLCFHAAEKLISDMNWDRSDIDCLVLITQTPDYTVPPTSYLLQKRLGLKEEVFLLDITQGCSGWVYGLQVISSLLSHGSMKKGLLLAGDTLLRFCSPEDKTTWPLFGDAGTVTALEYDSAGKGFVFHAAADGGKYDAIIIPGGGYRNRLSVTSFEQFEIKPGIKRNSLHVILDGMNVFSFSISRAPETVLKLSERYNIDLHGIDYFLFHQANFFMNERIRIKLKLPAEKVPYSLRNYGNTGPATIPLTMVSEISQDLQAKKMSIIACGFGVGLSWGSVQFDTDRIICSDIIEI